MREERERILADIDAARSNGASLRAACTIVGIGLRTYRCWRTGGEDGRGGALRLEPSHKLSVAEREASAPNQVWCWDVSYLPSGVRGLYFYLYLVIDLFSRKMVGWEVDAQECGEYAVTLIWRSTLAEGVGRRHRPLVLHADNGAPMKSAMLCRLGVSLSKSIDTAA